MSAVLDNSAPNRYFDRHFNRDAVKILPGEYYATRDNTMIVTVLGSCVSVCLRDPITNIGGMNHFLLPNDEFVTSGEMNSSARYGTYAMELLINELLKMGAARNRLEAKVFGGGNVLQGLTVHNVGERNSEFVLDYLQLERIPVLARDLLGPYPRKVYFFVETGEVKVRKIKTMHNTTILDRESEYRMRIIMMYGCLLFCGLTGYTIVGAVVGHISTTPLLLIMIAITLALLCVAVAVVVWDTLQEDKPTYALVPQPDEPVPIAADLIARARERAVNRMLAADLEVKTDTPTPDEDV